MSLAGVAGQPLAVQAQQAMGAAGPAQAASAGPDQTVPAAAVAPSLGYVLGARDTISVSVLGRTDYTSQVQVQEDGTIALPLIGNVTAANLTLPQLKSEIERRLVRGGFFLQPDVVISLVTVASQYATLLGDIQTPGLAPLDHQYRLSELIARANGVKPGSDGILVTLPGGESHEYSLRAISTNASPDPIVVPGSKIYVQPAQIFYIYGQVGSAGSYPVEPGMTVRMALARAGGLSALGSPKKIKIFRGEKVLKKVSPDMKLEAGDTLFIGERFF